jgi:nucleotide-binding universal stress UspA family protein
MIALKHILVPTDFSDASAIAVKYGVAFAHAFHATLHVLHVEGHRDFEAIVEAQRVVDEALGVPTPARVEPDVTVQEAAHELMARLLTPEEERGIRVEYVLRDGGLAPGPYAEIVRYAEEQTIDLIIIGTRGRGALAHMLRASVVDKVVRKAPCPVLTVHHHEHEFIVPDDGLSVS